MAQLIDIIGSNGSAGNAAGTFYYPIGNSHTITAATTESNVQFPFRQAGTFSFFRVRISANTVTASSTFNFRINGAAGNQTVSVASSTTGEFIDTTNTDTISSGDLVNLQLVAGGTGTSISMSEQGVSFTPSSGAYSFYACVINFNAAASTSYYFALGGTLTTTNTTEANVQVTARCSGTLKNGYARISSNGRSSATTIKSRKNGADGNISISITASTTGIFEDTSNTDSISSGDTVNMSFVSGSGTGTTQGYAGASYVPGVDNKLFYITSVAGGGPVIAGATTYTPTGGIINGSGTEASAQITSEYAWTASRLFCYSPTNASSAGSTTVVLRKNGSDGNNSISIGTGATGYFEDTTHTDSIAVSDKVTIKKVGATTGNTTLSIAGVHADFTPPTPPAVNKGAFFAFM